MRFGSHPQRRGNPGYDADESNVGPLAPSSHPTRFRHEIYTIRFGMTSCFGLALLQLIIGASRAAEGPSRAAEPAGRVLHVAPVRLHDVPEKGQFRTISEAAKAVEPADTVVIHDGVYREGVVVAKSGTAARPIRFVAAPAARVIVESADLITGWHSEGRNGERIFSVAWPHTFIGWSKTRTHPSDDHHLLIGRAELVFVQDFALRQVLRAIASERGTFFVDEKARRLFAWGSANEDLNGLRVEASVRSLSWDGHGDFVHLRGVRFRHAANAAQQAAAQFRGRGDIVEDCVFEQANSSGACFLGPDQVVRRCTFQDNGQLGWGANRANNLLFTACVTRRNDTKNFDRGWEAGGDKICLSRGVVIEHSRFEDNHGSGIWFDIGNEDCAVKNCLIADNQDAGIFYEISFGLHATDNVIVGNGLADTPGAGRLRRASACRLPPAASSSGTCSSATRRASRSASSPGRRRGSTVLQAPARSRSGTTMRPSATTSSPPTEMPRSGAGGTPMTIATGPPLRHCASEPGTPGSRSRRCTSPSPATCTTRPRASPLSAGASQWKPNKAYATLDEVRRNRAWNKGAASLTWS